MHGNNASEEGEKKCHIFFLTSNKHKYEEVKEIVKEYLPDVEVEQLDVDMDEIRSDSFENIAKHKVMIGYRKSRYRVKDGIVMAEDSGLIIDALEGFPGTYSAWIFKKLGVDGILRLMKGVNNRKAKYVAALAIYIPKKNKVITARGEVKGRIIKEKRGEGGFGYDPIFLPEGNTKTFAEDEEYKNKVSHRSKAIRKGIDMLIKELKESE